jgi:hypothetical protein
MHGMWNLVLMICVNICCNCECSVKSSALAVVMLLSQSSVEMANRGSECGSAM